MVAAAVVAMVPLCATAQTNGRHALTRVSGARITGAPLAQRPQTVMLKMAGDSVAVVRSRMPGKQIAEADRQSIEKDLRHKQDALVPSIEAIGGTVLGQFQHAINGIKVSATPDQIKAFASLPGVVAVKHVRSYHLDNAESVPFIGAPQAWQGPPGLHGEHIRVAVIDTGVDYTHANFGGPGTVAAWTTAFANNTAAPDPTMFGPNAPKVKGGIDLVGDAYDGVANNVPVPDPNPLDCNGHGSHTSGTATGFGVAAGGTTFKGPYDAATPGQSFIIGPGVAPLADLYAVRVFGCKGSTNVVIDGIDWAVAHNMQVISMSLGADWGTEDDADAEASENAVNAGIVVAAASGNEGPASYITSSPGSGDKVISVAAIDSHSSFPGETLTLTPSGSITALDANGIPVGNGTSLKVVVLKDTKGTGAGGISLGCDPAEYTAAGVAGKLVVTVRGSCARVDRAIYGQQAGAAAVAMINNAAGYPPYEGPINSNPDTGVPYTVTIPFLGVQGPPSTDGPTLAASTAASFATTTIANPTFRRFASFSSAGPRTADGHLKPDISAPGVSIFSTAMGTGNQGLFESGTSMATPHVAGSAALAIQAHPHWEAEEVAAAVVNTADAAKIAGYSARLGGNGLVQPFAATRTSVFAQAEDGTPSVSFGVSELTHDFSDESRIIVQNRDGAPASFSISVVQGSGAAHTATVSPTSITLSAHERRTVQVHLTVPVATVGDSSAFRQVQGRVVFTPTSGNNQVTLSVPYYLVPRARSMVDARLSESDMLIGQARQRVEVGVWHRRFLCLGAARQQRQLGIDRSACGRRAVLRRPEPMGQMLVFAVNTFGRTSNPATTVYDVLVDVNGDGEPDYDVEAVDLGSLTTGSPNGELVVAVFDLNLGGAVLEFFATAPTDGTTVLLPLVAADIGITAANPRFSYVALTTDLLSAKTDMTTSAASFNAFNSSISTGAYVSLAPGMKASVPLTINGAEFRKTPALGQMVVTLENKTKDNDQALLLRLGED